MSSSQASGPVVFHRIDVTRVTPRTAPKYGTITHNEKVSRHVLIGEGLLLLIGPLGVNYFAEWADSDVIYLHRWDVPPARVSARKLHRITGR